MLIKRVIPLAVMAAVFALPMQASAGPDKCFKFAQKGEAKAIKSFNKAKDKVCKVGTKLAEGKITVEQAEEKRAKEAGKLKGQLDKIAEKNDKLDDKLGSVCETAENDFFGGSMLQFSSGSGAFGANQTTVPSAEVLEGFLMSVAGGPCYAAAGGT